MLKLYLSNQCCSFTAVTIFYEESLSTTLKGLFCLEQINVKESSRLQLNALNKTLHGLITKVQKKGKRVWNVGLLWANRMKKKTKTKTKNKTKTNFSFWGLEKGDKDVMKKEKKMLSNIKRRGVTHGGNSKTRNQTTVDYFIDINFAITYNFLNIF